MLSAQLLQEFQSLWIVGQKLQRSIRMQQCYQGFQNCLFICVQSRFPSQQSKVPSILLYIISHTNMDLHFLSATLEVEMI